MVLQCCSQSGEMGSSSGGSAAPKDSLRTARRSGRNAPNTSWGSAPSTRSGDVQTPGSSAKEGAAEEEGSQGVPRRTTRSASASRDADAASATSRCRDGAAKRRRSERAVAGSVVLNKRKRMDTRSYIALFKPSVEAEDADVGVKCAKQSSIPSTTKKVKEIPFQMLERLPDGCHYDFDNDHLHSVNNLREFWHKSKGAAFVDDKEGITKTVLFIVSVLPDACQPFLVVTSSPLSLWEAEFNRLAPSINVVVYDGDKDVRKSIPAMEFNENGSSIMLHVLLAHPDAIFEDIETLKSKSWEAVIVDYCQNSVLKLPKQLTTDFRMLLLRSPVKDNLLEYKNLLAFLNSQEDDCGDHVDESALAILRARFTRHVAYERKANSLNFLEYWVPAYLSRVQIQLYISILLTNSSVLRSQESTDSFGTLRDIILCLWKCCDHPCIIDEFRQISLGNIDDTAESTDNKMCASGKLLLLEKMLKEIKDKRSRVIILFQSGENQMGTILEDFVRHRFGPESYVRLQNRSPFSKKQEAMSMFNDMTKGRFIFLIESNACHSSIRLSSIDAIIIYGSNWNPLNDLKALGKITMESQLEYVNIFRFYCPFTVEEKYLVLAKQGMITDTNIQEDISLAHSLLSWGVQVLFAELQLNSPASKSSEWGTVYMDKVISEFIGLSTNVEDNTKLTSATILKVCMSGEFYSRKMTLVGERTVRVSSLDGDPSHFWCNLLDREMYSRNVTLVGERDEEVFSLDGDKLSFWFSLLGMESPQSNMYESPQVSHTNFQNMEKPANAPVEETNKAKRKRRKTGVENLGTPKSLHVELKCELSKLIEVIKLPDNVCILAEQFLEYFMNNHLVSLKPRGLLHALNIALCWRAASILKYTKLDRKESLALAAECLNYECNEALTGVFYEKLGTLKKKVVRKPGGRSNKVRDGTFPSLESSSADLRNEHMFPKQAMNLHGNLTNGNPQDGLHGNFTNGTSGDISSDTEQMVSNGQELVSSPSPESDIECDLPSEESPNITVEKKIDLFDKLVSLREKNLHEKQQLELLELRTHRENQVIKLKDVCRLVVRHIRRSYIHEETSSDQLKLTFQWFTMLLYAFLEHMSLQFDKLEALQSATWSEERSMKKKLEQEVISGPLDESHELCTNIPDSNFVFEEFIHFKKQNDDHHDGKSLMYGCDQLLEVTLVQNPVPSEAFPTQRIRNEPVEALERSGRGAALESVDLPESIIHCSSDGIDFKRACCSSAIPGNHDLINQESSIGENRGMEHANRDNIANTSMFLGGPASLVVGLNENNDGTVSADPVHLESPISEVGTDANISNMSALQIAGTLQYPPAEVEPTNTLHVTAARDLQTSWSALDASPQRMCSDDSSQLGLEPDTPTGLLEEGTAPHHLGSIDTVVTDADSYQAGHQPETTPEPSQGVDVSNTATVCANQAHSTSPISAAPQNPPELPLSSEVGTCANLSSPLSQQSNVSPSRHPPVVADSADMLSTQAEQDLHPDMQPSTPLLDIPLERMSPNDMTQIGCRPVSSTKPSEECDTEYPARATHNVGALPLSTEAEADIGQTSMPAQESAIPHAHQSPPQEAESAGIVGMVPVADLQPSTSRLEQTAEAEQATMLSTAVSRDLQSETQPLKDGPLEADVSGISVTESTTDPQCVESTTVLQPADDLQPSASTLEQTAEAEQATMLSTVVSQDLQSETQPLKEGSLEVDVSGIPVTESTTDLQCVESTTVLQPAVDLQPSASMLEQTAEAEQATMLSTTVSQDLQPEMQPLITAEDGPLEADVSGMPVTESTTDLQCAENTTVLQCVEPSCHPHAEAVGNLQSEIQQSITTQDFPLETDLSGVPATQSTTILQDVEPSHDPHAEMTGTLGMVAAPDLHPEMQPSSSTQVQPAEVEGAGTLGTTAAQNLQPEAQPLTSAQHILPESIHPDERTDIVRPPNMTSNPDLLTQVFAASNHLMCSTEPLRNELEKLKYWQRLLCKHHDNKKSLLQTEYNQELDKLNRKYELLHEKEDSAYDRLTKELDIIYRKVYISQSLAYNFRENLAKSPASQERYAGPTIWQPPQSSQQADATSVAQTTISQVASALATQPQVFTSFHARGPSFEPSLVVQPRSEAIQLQPILPGNPYRRSSSPLSSMPPRHGSYGVAGAQPHGPTAYLRMPSPHATDGRYHQHPPVSRQSTPGIFGSPIPLAGVAVTSVASNSVHQTMPSAPNSYPAFYNMPGPLNAAAGMWQGGGHISGLGQHVPESALHTPPHQGRWQQGAFVTSMGSGSVHQTVPSVLNSQHPGLPGSSLLSGQLPPESMANAPWQMFITLAGQQQARAEAGAPDRGAGSASVEVVDLCGGED